MADGIYEKLFILNRPKYDKNKAVFNVIANYVRVRRSRISKVGFDGKFFRLL